MADANGTGPDGTVLIFRLGSLGDTIVTLPCFHAVERAFPGHRRLVLTNMLVSKAVPVATILGDGGFVHGAIEYPVGARSPLTFWRLRRTLRATGARTLVYLTERGGVASVRRDVAFFRLAGLRVIGAPLSDDAVQCRVDAATGELEPEAERLARSLAALGPIDLADRGNWDLRLSAAEQAAAAAALAPLVGRAFIAINLGGKVAAKDWGDANWTALMRDLARDHAGLGLVAVGGPEDAARSAHVLATWPGPNANLCGALTPRQSAAALSRARLFVGHDSGPLHLAASTGVGTVGIFGDGNRPRKWHPYGPANTVVHDMRGVSAITPERVAEAARAQLG